MSLRHTLAVAALLCAPIGLAGAQGSGADGWPTYNGDYSGRRFSALKQITASNVQGLTLAWMYRIPDVQQQRGVDEPTIKSTPLMVNGVLYFTIPDHVYALDARTGEPIWHYAWEDKGGHLVGQRGVGVYKDYVYFLAPDGWFLSAHEYSHTAAQVSSGILTTAGGLLFTGSTGANLVAHDPATGTILWHQRLLRAVSNGSSTWMLDGAQYLVVGASDTLYAFTLPTRDRREPASGHANHRVAYPAVEFFGALLRESDGSRQHPRRLLIRRNKVCNFYRSTFDRGPSTRDARLEDNSDGT